MSLNDLFCAALETGLNKLQELDGSSKKQRKKLAERVIAITFKEFNKSLYFVISEQQIDILSSFDGSTDCTIQLSVFALNDLKNNQKLTMLIREGQLDVIGDIQLAQQFAQLITTMDIDWEALLANKIGDVLAHKLCYLVSKGHQQINRQLQQKTTQRVALILAEKKHCANSVRGRILL